jgi:hypothetical protein
MPAVVTVKPIEIRYTGYPLRVVWCEFHPNNHHNSGAFITRNRRQDD